MTRRRHFIVDFDSTIVRVEALEVLAEMLAQTDRAPDVDAVKRITDQAMAGQIDFTEALKQRLELLRPRLGDMEPLARRLAAELTASVTETRGFFGSPDVYVLSGGFREWVEPVVGTLGVPRERVLANTFLWDGDGVAGFDADCPLARSGGKAEAVRALDLEGEVVVVGDGWTDYEVRAAGAAHRFYAFVENVERPRVTAHADRIARSFPDLLRQEGMAP